jgi:hypothetical protein
VSTGAFGNKVDMDKQTRVTETTETTIARNVVRDEPTRVEKRTIIEETTPKPTTETVTIEHTES